MLNKLRFRYKFMLMPAITVLALLLGLFLNFYYGRKNLEAVNVMANGHVPAWEFSRDFLQTVDSIQRTIQDAVSGKDIYLLKSAEPLRDRILERLERRKTRVNPDPAFYDDIKGVFTDYYRFAQNTSTRAIQGEKGEKIAKDIEIQNVKYNLVRTKLEANIATCKSSLTDSFGRYSRQNTAMIVTTLIGVIFFICLSIFVSMQVFKSVILPIHTAIDISDKVANGDLTVQVPVLDTMDESAIMLSTLKKMVDSLRSLTEQIKEAANALASASTEISASVTEIASGATETATAANETSTTVEEVRQTALDSNRKAKFVSESAQKAVQISQSGEKSVSTTIEGMRRIEHQMESIAESIMKLSEHGQAIGGIIATVEDVAEQSNLLAVNASIEAARAGEHGKGFAVVAQEVKSLAEQSKQATSKVRNILDDIQKATSGAVMTTEQGSKAVEAGVKQSTDAGESIQRLANSVAEAAQATTQISVSSQEQLVGMDQVVSAMESIKQASSQNVTATRQVETAAHDLQELGQRLKQLVEQYRL
jgi:methyl-accepting chemotaxis protein